MSTKFLVLGSGGREHALCWHLKKHGASVEAAPGSDAIQQICPMWDFSDFADLAAKIKQRSITDVIVGPEKYLAEGVADFLQAKNIQVFGPDQSAARLESDKAFAKDFLDRHKIPTARSITIRKTSDISKELSAFAPPYVVKASGLAAGKGVWIGSDKTEAENFAASMLKSHESVVIEDFLPGEELSYFLMIDGAHSAFIGAAQDHKRLLDNDEGPNTGGMGAYSPVPILTPELRSKIEAKIVGPTLQALSVDRIKYRGFFFIGLMISNDEPFVLEFNCRLGDPETQALLGRLKTPLPLLLESLRGSTQTSVEFDDGVALSVVVAAKGYPERPARDFDLPGIDQVPSDLHIFHSGTRMEGQTWKASGGRLFSVATLRPNLSEAQHAIYTWIESRGLRSITYRNDIGAKAFRHLIPRKG